MYSGISQQLADQIVSASRTAIGDDLRTVIAFTPDEYDVLYVRSDLYDGDRERVRAAKRAVVENERLGFATSDMYTDFGRVDGVEAGIGDYEFTQRVFENGFLIRITVGERGVVTTTDGFDLDSSRETVVAVRNLLQEASEDAWRSEVGAAG